MKINKNFIPIFDMPKEVMLNYPKITVVGEERVVVENHKGLIELSQTVIRLNTSMYLLKITGENLDIKSITGEDIEVIGKITGIIMS